VPLEEKPAAALADEDLETIKECDCVLLGAITTPLDPDYRSVLLRLRKSLDLYANIRPSDLAILISSSCGRTQRLYSGLERGGCGGVAHFDG